MDASPLTYQFAEFTLDVVRGCLLKAGQEIKLRPKVYETLKYLVQNPGRLISKQELIRALWPDAFVSDDSLVQCTVELRRALGDRDQQLLKTVPRRGYLFTAPVIRAVAQADLVSKRDSLNISERDGLAQRKPDKPFRNLPKPRTSLIGREQQVRDAVELLLRADVRLLTLTGTGGCGKTRLALALAEAVTDRFPGGVRFVGLASITDPELVETAIEEAFNVHRVPNFTIAQLVGEQLRESGASLLLLDNFEQVLPAASVVAEVLEACPSLKIVVTSRSGLRIYGEQEFPVGPLAQNSATELFVQRAAAVLPALVLSSENAPAIREICARLDGLPLAIELAAARSKVLSPTAMLDRLQSRLQLLTGGPLDLPERQQTLRNTIDWSHELLNEAERRLFRRLSVFVGGCTLEAAEAVCNTSRDLGIDLFEGLSSLVDKNLLERGDRGDDEPRFTMLETIREYALERLMQSGEQPALRRAHAAYFLVLAEEGNPELGPAERSRWLARCDVEIDNFRCALDSLFETVNVDWGLRLCVALFRFWDMHEHLTEGRSRLETVLHLAGNNHSRDRARVAQFLGALTTAQGDYAAAERYLQQSLALYQQLGDRWGIGVSLNALAVSARDRGDYSAAEQYFERSLACWRMLSDRLAIARCLHNLANVVKGCGQYARARSALQEAAQIFEELGDRNGAAWSLNQQGDIAREQGDLAEARGLYQSALSAFRDAGDRWGSARSLTDLGRIDCEQGNYLSAEAAYREALEIFAALAHRRGLARALEGSACLALARGYSARALKLAAAAANLRRLIGAPLPQAEQAKLDQILLPAWTQLGGDESKRAWTEGSSLSLEQAIEYSMAIPEPVIPA